MPVTGCQFVRKLANGAAGAGLATLLSTGAALAAGASPADGVLPSVAGIPVDFILFALTLAGVALFHHHTFWVALVGLASITGYKLAFTGFKAGAGVPGLILHLEHEWVVLANLFLLLMGFALLARHFEKSGIPDVMPALLPDDWKGAFLMLAIVWFISSFLGNTLSGYVGVLFEQKILTASQFFWFLTVLGVATGFAMWAFAKPLNRVISSVKPAA